MRPIPLKLRKEISNDPFYKRCCITGSINVSLEHCWTYSGRQINELWAIVPLDRELNTSHPPKEVKEKCKLISLQRATPEDLAKYSKVNWQQELNYLSNKYMKKKETKPSKFKKCPKCHKETMMTICDFCGTFIGSKKNAKSEPKS
jgi:hypothetical protein